MLHALVLTNPDRLDRWMPWAVHEPISLEQRRTLIAQWARSRRYGGDAIYAVTVNDTPIGSCGLHYRNGPIGLEIGYWLAADACGNGYATEAAQLLTRTALEHPGIEHVEIHHDRANHRSAGIPRRLGYTRTGEQPSTREIAPGGDQITITWRSSATK